MIRSGILAATLLLAAFSYSLLCTSKAEALSLDVKLPTGSLLKPVTDLTNPITSQLPVSTTIKSNPDTLGLSADLSTNPQPNAAPTAELNVSLPVVSEVLNQPVKTVNSLVSPSPNTHSSRPATTPSTNTSVGSTTQTPSPTASQKPEDNTAPSNHKNTSPIVGITSFFSSTMPDALRSIASQLVGKPVKLLPVIISSAILLLTLGGVGAIMYASNRRGILSLGKIGQINLSRYVETHDVAQVASLIVASLGFGVVASFLVLAGL
jgi:hypothetical protein